MHNNQAIPFNKENFKLIFSKEFALVITLSIPSALIAEFFDIILLRGEIKIFLTFNFDLKIPSITEDVMWPVPKNPKFMNYAQ